MTKQALIIIDVQNDYFTGFKLVNPEKALDNTLRVLAKFREMNQMVVYIKQIAFPVKGYFVDGTPGCELHPKLSPRLDQNEYVFKKKEINSFINTGLEETLKKNGITKLVITGNMSHMCVDSATRAAYDLGWRDITVIEDCCATKDLTCGNKTTKAEEVQTSFMSALGFAFAKVITTDEFMKPRVEQ